MSAKLICSLQNKSFVFCLVLTCSLQTRPTDCKLQVPIQLEFSLIPSHFPTAVALAISEECVNHTKDYVEALRNQSPWAVQSKSTLYLFLFDDGSYVMCLQGTSRLEDLSRICFIPGVEAYTINWDYLMSASPSPMACHFKGSTVLFSSILNQRHSQLVGKVNPMNICQIFECRALVSASRQHVAPGIYALPSLSFLTDIAS